MAQAFNPERISRRVELRFDKLEQIEMQKRVVIALREIERVQGEMLRWLGTTAFGRKTTPSTLSEFLGDGTRSWAALKPETIKRKRQNKDRFFLHTGQLAADLANMDPFFTFGRPRAYQARNADFTFSRRKSVWQVSFFPKVRRNPGLTALETTLPGIPAQVRKKLLNLPNALGQGGGTYRPALAPLVALYKRRIRNAVFNRLNSRIAASGNRTVDVS